MQKRKTNRKNDREPAIGAMILAQQSNEKATHSMVDFVSAEVAVAWAFCWIAKTAGDHKRARCLDLAKEAHGRATRALPTLTAKPGWAELVTELDELSREFVRFETELEISRS